MKKTPMLGKIEGEKVETEDEMVGWHHRLIGHEFEQAPGYSEGALQSMGSQRVGASEGQQGTQVFLPLHAPPPSVKELLPGLPLLLDPRPQDMASVDPQPLSTNLVIQVCLSVC